MRACNLEFVSHCGVRRNYLLTILRDKLIIIYYYNFYISLVSETLRFEQCGLVYVFLMGGFFLFL